TAKPPAPAAFASRTGFFIGVQLQRGPVHAVAQARRPRPVVEDVAEMRLAGGAAHLRAHHAVGTGADLLGGGRLNRLEEARPARARIEFGLGPEQRCAAGDAAEEALGVVVPVRAGESAFGAGLA